MKTQKKEDLIEKTFGELFELALSNGDFMEIRKKRRRLFRICGKRGNGLKNPKDEQRLQKTCEIRSFGSPYSVAKYVNKYGQNKDLIPKLMISVYAFHPYIVKLSENSAGNYAAASGRVRDFSSCLSS